MAIDLLISLYCCQTWRPATPKVLQSSPQLLRAIDIPGAVCHVQIFAFLKGGLGQVGDEPQVPTRETERETVLVILAP